MYVNKEIGVETQFLQERSPALYLLHHRISSQRDSTHLTPESRYFLRSFYNILFILWSLNIRVNVQIFKKNSMLVLKWDLRRCWSWKACGCLWGSMDSHVFEKNNRGRWLRILDYEIFFFFCWGHSQHVDSVQFIISLASSQARSKTSNTTLPLS